MSQSLTSNLFTMTDAGHLQPASFTTVIAAARAGMDALLSRGTAFSSPGDVKSYMALKLGQEEREVFAVVFLDSQHRVIEYRELFHGTLTQTSVYPREVIKASLRLNAGALILVHNHPSGVAEPSRADECLTQTLKAALAMVDVRVIDHLVVAGGTVLSFAERGLL